jgi:pyruvate/2-oxoglutarate dehydrogenase complex dihydrolipoamide acyltransferase (E2) component
MDVLMPQLGETVAEGKISKWFVKAGDSVKPGQNLFEIETDKVSMEVPAIAAGTLAAIHVAAGEVAPVGAVVAIIQGKGETVSLEAPLPLIPAKAGIQSQRIKSQRKEPDSRFRGNERSTAGEAVQTTARQMDPFREVRSPERNYGPARLPGGTVVTPLARRLAGEAGIDLTKIKGTGPHGRIVAADIASAKKTPAPPQSAAANIVLTADIELTQVLALVADVKGVELRDIVVKAWSLALARASLDATEASSTLSIPDIPGIVSVVDVLRPPQTTRLSLGAPRRAPVEAADGSVKFVSVMTATLSCDARALDATQGAQLLATFRSFVQKPVLMLV